jgi:hypothetical protein
MNLAQAHPTHKLPAEEPALSTAGPARRAQSRLQALQAHLEPHLPVAAGAEQRAQRAELVQDAAQGPDVWRLGGGGGGAVRHGCTLVEASTRLTAGDREAGGGLRGLGPSPSHPQRRSRAGAATSQEACTWASRPAGGGGEGRQRAGARQAGEHAAAAMPCLGHPCPPRCCQHKLLAAANTNTSRHNRPPPLTMVLAKTRSSSSLMPRSASFSTPPSVSSMLEGFRSLHGGREEQ